MSDYVTSGPLAVWVAEHRGKGHEPHPAPTPQNPERWECQCQEGGMTAVWRRLTPAQIQAKYAHLRTQNPEGMPK